MKTKNILKAAAFAMLMPAVLLTTSCSKDDDPMNNGSIANPENTEKKGYELPVPVTVSVTMSRQFDEATTRATFNDGTKKLSFSTGDKLFVRGEYDNHTKKFAGVLDYVSEGKFSGTVTTETEYTGTVSDLLAISQATLLPEGYETIGFLVREVNDGYNDDFKGQYDKAFVTSANSKAYGIEQLSWEMAPYSSGGYALVPQSAILSFTITGLAASTSVAVALTKDSDPEPPTVSGNVTTDASGTATFAIGVDNGDDLNKYTLTVGGNAITLGSASNVLVAGKIYNITRSVASAL